jgi:hypothetical protein
MNHIPDGIFLNKSIRFLSINLLQIIFKIFIDASHTANQGKLNLNQKKYTST